MTNPIGLGHTRRDMAVAEELRRHHPDLDVQWHWIRGHSGHPENERADALARGAIPGQLH